MMSSRSRRAGIRHLAGGSPPARSPRRSARLGKGRPSLCADGQGGGAQRTTLPGVVGWENERAALISRRSAERVIACFAGVRTESRVGRSGAWPGAGAVPPGAPAQADGRRSDERARVSVRVPPCTIAQQEAAPRKAERSGAVARCLAGSKIKAATGALLARISSKGAPSWRRG